MQWKSIPTRARLHHRLSVSHRAAEEGPKTCQALTRLRTSARAAPRMPNNASAKAIADAEYRSPVSNSAGPDVCVRRHEVQRYRRTCSRVVIGTACGATGPRSCRPRAPWP